MMRQHDPLHRQGGLTLIEIMVALVVSLILIAGVIQIFVGTRQTYRFQDALARVQENGRYAAEVIGRDARLAGYAGCTSLISVTPNTIPPVAVAYSRDNYIFGNDPGLPAAPGTDSLTLRMLSPDFARLSGDMSGPNDDIVIAANIPNLAVNQIVGIADCNNIDIFRVNTVAGTSPVTITPHAGLTKAYLTGAIVSRFEEVSYFVQPGAGGALALWRRDAAGDTELVEGIEDLWLRYGVDTNNDGAANLYVEAAGVADWSRVRSIRVSLLLASDEDNVTGGAQPVDFRGGTVTDSRYKQVLTTTIGLRNRLP
jgi:type IV pilus assembly protein PilW